jgi:aerobic carbon-monoxide dehydrogenase medium subunit
MQSFAYHKPASVEAAAALLGQSPENRLLAGGMSLLPTMKLRLAAPDALVDLSAIGELKGITVADGVLRIGAMTRHVDVARSETAQRTLPALAALAGGIGDPQVRNRGTIGGSLANNDPAADYPAAVLGLGASIVTDHRTIAADAFFTAMFQTALAPGEIITAVAFPIPITAGYAKFASQASRFALTGVFVGKFPSGVRVGVTGAAGVAFRAAAIEAALADRFEPYAVNGIQIDETGLLSDIHAEAAYRAHLVTVMAKRAVTAAKDYAGRT